MFLPSSSPVWKLSCDRGELVSEWEFIKNKLKLFFHKNKNKTRIGHRSMVSIIMTHII